MLKVLCEVLIGPLLVACSTLVARRWGARIGGVISGFPAVVGPVLLIVAEEHGAASAASAARGTLVGIVALSAFILAYAAVAQQAGWRAALLAGWFSAAIVSVVLALTARALTLPADVAAAAISLTLAYWLMPRGNRQAQPEPAVAAPRHDLLLRMAATATLVVVLSAAVQLVGTRIGGLLAALPVLASILAVFTHRDHGAHAVVSLLRGMLIGMAGFVSFCVAVAVVAPSGGILLGFTTATLVALGVHAVTVVPRIRTRADRASYAA